MSGFAFPGRALLSSINASWMPLFGFSGLVNVLMGELLGFSWCEACLPSRRCEKRLVLCKKNACMHVSLAVNLAASLTGKDEQGFNDLFHGLINKSVLLSWRLCSAASKNSLNVVLSGVDGPKIFTVLLE